MKLNKIETTTKYKILQIREIMDDGSFHRRMLSPNQDISGEVQEIQDKAGELWTDEVKSSYAEFKAEQAKEAE